MKKNTKKKMKMRKTKRKLMNIKNKSKKQTNFTVVKSIFLLRAAKKAKRMRTLALIKTL